MLTKNEQLLISALRDSKLDKKQLSSFYSNERSLYRSALKLKRLNLLKYDGGEFNLTFQGWILSAFLTDIKKMEDGLNESKTGKVPYRFEQTATNIKNAERMDSAGTHKGQRA